MPDSVIAVAMSDVVIWEEEGGEEGMRRKLSQRDASPSRLDAARHRVGQDLGNLGERDMQNRQTNRQTNPPEFKLATTGLFHDSLKVP